MSISKRKLKANRANAQKSTGPRTAAGLETVSHNRTTHGLCGRFRVLPCEDQAEYDGLLERFLQAEQPRGDVERELVAMRREAALQPVVTETKMTRHTWLSERATRFQEACFLFQLQPRSSKRAKVSPAASSRTFTSMSVTKPPTTAPISAPPMSSQNEEKTDG